MDLKSVIILVVSISGILTFNMLFFKKWVGRVDKKLDEFEKSIIALSLELSKSYTAIAENILKRYKEQQEALKADINRLQDNFVIKERFNDYKERIDKDIQRLQDNRNSL